MQNMSMPSLRILIMLACFMLLISRISFADQKILFQFDKFASSAKYIDATECEEDCNAISHNIEDYLKNGWEIIAVMQKVTVEADNNNTKRKCIKDFGNVKACKDIKLDNKCKCDGDKFIIGKQKRLK